MSITRLGRLQTRSTRTGWKNQFLIIATLLTGTPLTGPLGAADPNRADETIVSGVVLKPDGTPAAGAAIRSGTPTSTILERRLGRQFTSKTSESIADMDGRFSISMTENPYADLGGLDDRWRGLKNSTVLAASLPGFGPAWLPFDDLEANRQITLRLVDDLTIRGQVVDLEGTPVRGTTVTLAGAYGAKGDDLTDFFSKLDRIAIVFKQPPTVLRSIGVYAIDGHLLGLPEKFTTDQDGWLEIKGLGRERLLQLAFTGGDVAYRVVAVASRDMQTIQPQQTRQSVREPIFGSQFKIPVEQSRPVEGVAIDAETEEPLADVSIEIQDNSERRLMKSVSDHQGRFRVMGLPKASRNRLMFATSDDRPYFPLSVGVPDSPGIEPVVMNIKLHRGIWIKGRVTDKATHTPVVGVHLHYYPLLSNENASRVPTFHSGGFMDNDWNRYQTDAFGVYCLIGLPGPAIVGAENEFMSFRPGVGFDEIKSPTDSDPNRLPTWRNLSGANSERTFLVQRIDPGADEKEVQLDLELDPGLSTTIRVVDQEGNLVKGTFIYGTGVRGPKNGAETFEDGIATVANLGPDEKRILHAYHGDRELGLKFLLEPPYEAGRDKELVLEPLATVTGRLLEAGEPLRGVGITRMYRENRVLVSTYLPPAIITDADGRFRITLIPGHEYELSAQERSADRRGRPFTRIAGELNVRSGETIELGDLEQGKDGFYPVKKQEVLPKEPENESGKTPPPDGPPKPPAPPAPDPNADQARKIDVETPTEAAKSSDEINVTGVVLKPDGSPAAGATVRSAARVWPMLKRVLPAGFVPKITETQADADGKFSISISSRPFGELKNIDERLVQSWRDTEIAASLGGFGPAWVEYNEVIPGQPLTLRLVDDHPIRGQVLDLEGNPVSGIKVQLSGLRASKEEDLSAWISGIQRGQDRSTALTMHIPRQVALSVAGIRETVSTDENGRFEIQGVGKERTIRISLGGATVAHRSVTCVSREMEPLQQYVTTFPTRATEPVFGSKFKFAVPPSRPIEGVVMDASTGEPLAGVSVESYRFADLPIGNNRSIKAVTDATGRFRLAGMPKAAGNTLVVNPKDEQPYLVRAFDVPDPVGIEAVELRIELHRGIWIKGRVTDKVTHEPVAGVSLYYMPYHTNDFSGRLPEFQRGANGSIAENRYFTDSDGNYKLVGLPGSAIVGARSMVKSYRNGVGYETLTGPKGRMNRLLTAPSPNLPSPDWPSVMHEINPAAEDQEVRVDLELDPGFSVRLRIVDQRGQPVEGAEIEGLEAHLNPRLVKSDLAVQTVVNLGTDETRTLIILHKARKIGLIFQVKPPHESGQEVRAELLPFATVTGRLLGREIPLLDVVISPRIKFSEIYSHLFPEVASDAEGRFRCSLLPGTKYLLMARGQGITKNVTTVASELSVTAGETTDLGDLALGDDGKFHPVKAAENDAAKNKTPGE